MLRLTRRAWGGGRSREPPVCRQRIQADGACGAGPGTADALQPLLLLRAGDRFSFHPRDEVSSAARNLLCKIICVALFFGGGVLFYFILQFFLYFLGKEPEVIFLEVADLARSPQP